MKKSLLYILLFFFATAILQAQQTDTTSSGSGGFDFDQMVDDITDIPLFLDALQARRSINVSDSGRFSNKPLATFLNLFLREKSIEVGLTESVETTNIFGTYFDITKPRGTYREGSGNHFLIFQLNFVPNAQNKREYQIKIDVEKSFAVVSNGGVDEEKWTKFDEYIDKINNDPATYVRADFRNAVNTLISKALLILLGIENYPLEVDIIPLAGASGIDRIFSDDSRILYEQIVVGGKPKSVTNIALKQNDAVSLQAIVTRMEIDSIQKDITLSNGKTFNQNLSSFDSVKPATYTATIKGDDAISATYELQYEDRRFTELAGKLNISVYGEKDFKVKLVPLENTGRVDGHAVQEFLNKVYGQAVVKWNVTVDQTPLRVDRFNGRLKTESGALSNYSPDMNSIISAYKKDNKIESNVYYIFIVPQFEDSRIIGYMPKKRTYGFVAYNANRHNVDPEALARTIAHELGHGAFRLQHPFSEYPVIRQGSTNNLMDYVTAIPPGGGMIDISRLYKYQWDFIHNPEGGLYWFQDEEDMLAMGDIHSGFGLEINKRLLRIGEQLGEKKFVIVYSTNCPASINEIGDIGSVGLANDVRVSVNLDGASYEGVANVFSTDERITIVLGIEIEERFDEYPIPILRNTDIVKVDDSETGTFLGVVTANKVYSCIPPSTLTCERARESSGDFYSAMLTAVLNCLKDETIRHQKFGEKFRISMMRKHSQNASMLNEIANSSDRIADILFDGQRAGNEWEEYGRYFEASFEAALANQNIDNGDYLKRLNEFIRIFQNKLSQLNLTGKDKIALFVGTFTDNELLYLPMDLRITTLNTLTNVRLITSLLRNERNDLAVLNWAMQENMILKLLERIEYREQKDLLEKLRTSGVVKAINDNLNDFITLVDDNYTKFLDIIDRYVYSVNTINEPNRGNWLQTLYDNDKIFNISKITKEGESFIAATRLNNRGEVEFQMKEFNGNYRDRTVRVYDEEYIIRDPLFDTRKVNVSFDEPIVIFHNANLSGVNTEHMGTMQIASSLRAHYYLQKQKDAQTATVIWTTIDVASLLVGVGQISTVSRAATVAVRNWRLVFGITNTASSIGSLTATGLESHLRNYAGGDAFISSLRNISAILGVADLGGAGISKLRRMLNDDLVIIGRFHNQHGAQMARNPQTSNLEQNVKRLVDSYDDDLIRLVNNAGNFPSLTRQMTLRPSYIPNRSIYSNPNKTTTFIGKWEDVISGQERGLKAVHAELTSVNGVPGLSTTDLNIYMISGKLDHPGGFNMLSIEGYDTRVVQEAARRNIRQGTKAFDDFVWENYNRPWLESAMQRGDDIVIWSNPHNLPAKEFTDGIGISFFEREIDFLRNNSARYGYNYNNGINSGTFSK
jgi:succinate dehydrogenase flavin-adding protein (antitoxin of CptAB toxin-antitoxin module)